MTPRPFFGKPTRFWRRLPHRSADQDMVIGEVLKKQGLISDEQLVQALAAQKSRLIENGEAVPIGMVIVERGYATEAQVVAAVNAHYRLSVSSLSDNIRGLVGKLRGSFIDRLPRPSMPIWAQLSITMMLVIALTAATMDYFILNRQKEQLYNRTLKVGLVSLNYFDNNAKIPLLEDNLLELNGLLKNAVQVEGIVYAFITGTDAKIKAHTDLNMIGESVPSFGRIKNVRHHGDDTYFTHRLPDGEQVLNIWRPIIFQNVRLGTVHVGVSINFIEELIDTERLTLTLTTLVIILFGLALSLFLGFYYSRPIKKLVAATHEISRGNYRHKVKLNRNDELGNLSRAFNQMGEELWRNSMMRESFGKYVGNDVLDLIMADPERAWLKGNRHEATILFADIRGFTAFSDERQPEQVIDMLNEYFGIVSRAVVDFGGYVDKFMGDAVMGVFGVPVFRKNHVERGLRAALAIQKELRNACKNGNTLLKSVGIGLDTGVIVSGNIGSQEKMEYTVIGGNVNAASRFSDLAGPGEVIIGRNVYLQVKKMVTVEAQPARVIKGFADPVETYKVLGECLRGDRLDASAAG